MQRLTAFAAHMNKDWGTLLHDPDIFERLVLIPEEGLWIMAQVTEIEAPPMPLELQNTEASTPSSPSEGWKTIAECIPEPLHKKPISIKSVKTEEVSLKGRRCRIRAHSFGGGVDWRTTQPSWQVNFAPNLSSHSLPPVCLESVLEMEAHSSLHYGVQVTFGLEHLWVDLPVPQNNAGRPASHLPHTCFVNYQRSQKPTRAESWNQFRSLAKESKGEKPVDIPGYGLVFMKLDRHDVENTVRYSDISFTNGDDGKTIKKETFNKAWDRAKGT